MTCKKRLKICKLVSSTNKSKFINTKKFSTIAAVKNSFMNLNLTVKRTIPLK